MADPHRPPSHLILPSNCTDSTIQKIQNELKIEGVQCRTFFIEEGDGTYIPLQISSNQTDQSNLHVVHHFIDENIEASEPNAKQAKSTPGIALAGSGPGANEVNNENQNPSRTRKRKIPSGSAFHQRGLLDMIKLNLNMKKYFYNSIFQYCTEIL